MLKELDAIYRSEIAKRQDISQYFSLMSSSSRGRANIGFYSSDDKLSNIVAAEQKHQLDNVEERNTINFSTSNYLGLGQSPEVVEAAKQALDEFGTGSNGSPILSGYYRVHHELEKQLSHVHGYDDTMLTSSGFIANIMVMTTLFSKGDTIFLEKNTHGSIIMGAGLSGATVRLFSENNADSLEKLLKKTTSGKKLIVTCGVFSMSGHISDLPALAQLAKKYDALLMIDDAHAFGVIGPNGYGTVEHFGMHPDQVDIHVGTLSKSLSACGGYISARKEIIRFLRLSALPYLLSASLPPSIAASALKALSILQDNGKQMTHALSSRVHYFKEGLAKAGIHSLGDSAIVVIPMEDTEKTMRLSHFLHSHNIYANGIVPPGVRRGEERIRFNITMTHSFEDLALSVDRVAEGIHRL